MVEILDGNSEQGLRVEESVVFERVVTEGVNGLENESVAPLVEIEVGLGLTTGVEVDLDDVAQQIVDFVDMVVTQ